MCVFAEGRNETRKKFPPPLPPFHARPPFRLLLSPSSPSSNLEKGEKVVGRKERGEGGKEKKLSNLEKASLEKGTAGEWDSS